MFSKENYYDYNELDDMGVASRVTICKWYQEGKFPKPVTLSDADNATRLFPKDEVDAWLANQLNRRIGGSDAD